MAIDYKIDIESGLLRTFWSGEIGDADFIARYLDILEDPDFAHVRKELTDLAQVHRVNLTAGAMQEIATETSRRLGSLTVKTSVYAPTDSTFGQARMYFAYADDAGSETVNVFRSLQEVEDWLDI